MSERPARHPVAMKHVVYEIPGMESAVVRRDEPYRTTPTGPLTMDVYYPASAAPDRPLPAVIVVLGYAPKTPNPLGCAFKEMEGSVGWGRLIAASGLAAIFYTSQEPDADLRAVLHHVREHAADDHRPNRRRQAVPEQATAAGVTGHAKDKAGHRNRQRHQVRADQDGHRRRDARAH